MPTKSKKKRLTGIGTYIGTMCPIVPTPRVPLTFSSTTPSTAARSRCADIIDEFTREALDIRVDHSISADDVVNTLQRLALQRGAPPAFVRFDNGPEFVVHTVADWCVANGTDTVFIDPGSPWPNAWIESFNGKFRDELLNL